ncbi:SH3 domain-containing protein 21 [Chlamydotis macqueenii]
MPKRFPVQEEKAEPQPAVQCLSPILPPELAQEPQLCRALFNGTPELPLRRGGVIQVLSKQMEAEGWWDGQCQHQRGLFPSSVVELQPAPVPALIPAMPSRDAEPSEPGCGSHPAPGASVSRQDRRVAPRPGAKWVGAAGDLAVPGGRRSPVGSEDTVWTSTEVLSASTSFPARSRFPAASRAPCGAVAAEGAWHDTAQHGLAGSPAPAAPDEPLCSLAACETAKDEEGEHPGLPAPVPMEPAKLPPSKRMAPAPPVPAKAKPVPALASKPAAPQPCALADTEQGRACAPDADGFNAVPVTTAKLSHPTTARPRVPGQRPPSLAPGSARGPCEGERRRGPPCAPLPGTGQVPGPLWGTEAPAAPRPEDRLALEDLKAEVRTLHILVDLMRVQHLRDLEDMRLEMCQERAQRQALQAEIERVRRVLPC